MVQSEPTGSNPLDLRSGKKIQGQALPSFALAGAVGLLRDVVARKENVLRPLSFLCSSYRTSNIFGFSSSR
ncbi:hypothetical protein K9M59_02695 [Candidatus Gracilibacteria bacterium]|nr:hypothetical protein [Candidatus Gracilibacteria bacterium]MCF7819240.1 hypothetical protein [Candidatus Gracilibacteria bacterium]